MRRRRAKRRRVRRRRAKQRRVKKKEGGEKAGEGEEKEGEGEEGEEGEEKEEEEAEGKDDVSRAVAGLLIATVGFIAAIFYLVNHSDNNIRQYTWDLMSDTMSIFCAVLWYQGVDALFDEKFEEEDDQGLRIVIELLHFLVWYIGVQAIAISMCESKSCGRNSFKASCVLGAHLCGFAAKGMFNTLMQTKTFSDNCGVAIVSVIICIVSFFIICMTAYAVRRLVIYPKMRESQAEMCKEEIIEVENDMISLCVGFLISQVIRFAIHGKLPTEELDEKDNHKQWEAFLLLFFAFLFGIFSFAFVALILKIEPEGHLERFLDLCKTTVVFVMAWCLLFWGQWEIMDAHFTEHLVLARIVLAASLSVGLFVLIFILDFIADRAKLKAMKRGVRLLISGFGLSIAFAWEGSFDFAVESVAGSEEGISESSFKLLLALGLVIVVAPAWAWYVLPKTSEYEPEEEEPSGGEEGKSKEVGEEGGADEAAATKLEPVVAIAPNSPGEIADVPQKAGGVKMDPIMPVAPTNPGEIQDAW